ncbi:MAG: cyclic nucleotide-binding domain-containing protein [Elusimicrobia bacterium]|nr:cyclic nucleotide-binding domain-containing protein [Elusimicrobiota bacterium]
MKKELSITQDHWDWLGGTLSRHAQAKIAPTLIKLIMPGVRLFEFAKNEVIIIEGDIGREMYAIYKGGVSVGRGRKKLAQLKEGDYFGEISLVAKVPRTATVKASKTCQAFELSWRAVTAIDEYFPELMISIQNVARRRLEDQ